LLPLEFFLRHFYKIFPIQKPLADLVMDYCLRTNRRKVKKAVDSILSKISTEQIPKVVYIDKSPSSLQTFDFQNCFESASVMINASETIENIESNVIDTNFDSEFTLTSDEECETKSYSDTSESSSSEASTSEFDIKESLCNWCSSYNISHSATSDLLQILRCAGLQLPKDPRSLLHTPNSIQLQHISGGDYYHCGIENGIAILLQHHDLSNICDKILINISIDGLPLFRSSKVQLWPILGNILQLPQNAIFVIGLYSGTSKPSSVSEYLKNFIDEMKNLMHRGITYLGKHYSVGLNAFICDAPARAYF
jgi:hypothetical protein